ncbi:hypothetical protein KIN20_000848 [Parelaphostrongylus tenuis]|uniref:Uncharacterized protein n=1 Tax=Parelaphostrongylus tenuis TaxID=148309 RepID=A0AAD5MED6_PARTN|nr:hypothetical protein KIN20_000848 [Parelaphostrongylus tenuis]
MRAKTNDYSCKKGRDSEALNGGVCLMEAWERPNATFRNNKEIDYIDIQHTREEDDTQTLSAVTGPSSKFGTILK